MTLLNTRKYQISGHGTARKSKIFRPGGLHVQILKLSNTIKSAVILWPFTPVATIYICTGGVHIFDTVHVATLSLVFTLCEKDEFFCAAIPQEVEAARPPRLHVATHFKLNLKATDVCRSPEAVAVSRVSGTKAEDCGS